MSSVANSRSGNVLVIFDTLCDREKLISTVEPLMVGHGISECWSTDRDLSPDPYVSTNERLHFLSAT